MRYFIFLTILLLIASCRIFEPREAEKPGKPVEWNAFPTSPEKCMENLIYSYNYRENVYQYGSLLSDEFKFYFDPQDVSDFTTPSMWYKTNEIDMLMNVYQQTGDTQELNLVLSAIPGQSDNYYANNAWIYRFYELQVNHSLTNLSTDFSGKFQILLERESNGLWKIKEWYDYRNQSEWTWGRMKNAFAS